MANNEDIVESLAEIARLLQAILSELETANSKLGWIESNTDRITQ